MNENEKIYGETHYNEVVLGFISKCSKCGKQLNSGQTAYIKITESGNNIRIGAPICYNCKQKESQQ